MVIMVISVIRVIRVIRVIMVISTEAYKIAGDRFGIQFRRERAGRRTDADSVQT
jgi:hypothetical protein